MIQKLVTLLVVLCISSYMQAQGNKKPGFSKEEFRARQEGYLTEKAELTKEEAAKFFPVYFELQDRKKAINDQGWKLIRKGRNSQITEAEYEQINESIIRTRIETDKLDLEYLQKFKQILSARKIFKIQHAEMKFHRDILKIMHQPKEKNK